MPQSSVSSIQVNKFREQHLTWEADLLVVEEPLEIRIGYGPMQERIQHSLSVTMRTPGHDFELAAGFLLTEGIIREATQIASIRHCTDLSRQEALENVVRVELSSDCPVDLPGLQRHFYTSSSCGVCGKTSIEAVRTAHSQRLPAGQPVIDAALLKELPDRLREAQTVFAHTGGLHAAALYDTDGRLLMLREDVGRHNALDKLIGACLFGRMIPLHKSLVLVSGRTSFELVQKAWIAGIPLLAAVGAPSSLAAQLAEEAGMTLLGFVRDGRFNVYTGMERIQVS